MANKKDVIVEETEVLEDTKATKQESKKAPAKVARKYEPDEMITCRSLTYGELLLTGKKSKLLYSWANYGDTTEVEYQDLQALKSTKSSYLYKPRFVIEDEENNIFGGFINAKIIIDFCEYQYASKVLDNEAFFFSLRSNGRLQQPTKFINKSEII